MLASVITNLAWADTGRVVQERIDADLAAGSPVVVHVVVALCDNTNQGIVPVSEALGNGQDPRTNLYWGALYGVRTHFPRSAGWTRLDTKHPENPRILDRVVMFARIDRGDVSVPVYVVADAWDGAQIRQALASYLQMASGGIAETVAVNRDSDALELRAGGAAHLLAYVGHNGLMDFSLKAPAQPAADAPARSAIVLACASKSYFLEPVRSAGAHPLLMTTGLMAPEAYTLDSAIRSWIGERTTTATVEAAAGAYDRYQKCGIGAARRLFWGAP